MNEKKKVIPRSFEIGLKLDFKTSNSYYLFLYFHKAKKRPQPSFFLGAGFLNFIFNKSLSLFAIDPGIWVGMLAY